MRARHIYTLLVAALLGLGLMATPLLADSYDRVTIGARAEAMGGAAIASSEDSTALANNPAVLVRLRRSELLLVGRWLSDRETTSRDGSRTQGPEQRNQAFGFAGGAYVASWAGRPFVLAGGLQRPLELVTHFRGEAIGGGVLATSAAASLAFNNWLSAGVALNVWGGTRDFSHQLDGSHLWWKSTYSGNNATIGLLGDLSAAGRRVPLRVGLVVHTPFDLRIDYHERTTTAGTADALDAWRYRVEMPWMVGLGLAYDPLPDWTIALDVERRAFGDREIIAVRGAERIVTSLSASGKDLTPVRLGVEKRLTFSRWQVPVRIGVRTMPTLRADRIDGVAEDQVVGRTYTGGLGLARGPLALDLTYSHSRYEASSISPGSETISIRTYRVVMLGLKYSF